MRKLIKKWIRKLIGHRPREVYTAFCCKNPPPDTHWLAGWLSSWCYVSTEKTFLVDFWLAGWLLVDFWLTDCLINWPPTSGGLYGNLLQEPPPRCTLVDWLTFFMVVTSILKVFFWYFFGWLVDFWLTGWLLVDWLTFWLTGWLLG